ncbi:hypothetical protein BB559_001484 [Furculomyces boomerangus]|uniref:Uncharacterized protein n=1 Tax=Furculomyces boomerangus TaxID=61424 RepID=A0A2T9Z1V5_9FUNG|nr:hypothetical protein BB559_001484 [Furculomyces boomerangus]
MKSKVKSRANTSASTTKKFSGRELVPKIQELIDDENYQLAEKFTKQALELEPKNPKLLLQAAIVKFEMGKPDPAIMYLKRCIKIEPEEGHEKYLYLGQMSTEHEAIKYFEKGIHILKKMIDKSSIDTELADYKRKVAEAYISMTEIYLSDLCFENDAEQRCENYIDLGIKTDPTCPVLYQTMASVRMSQNRPEEAKSALVHSISLWKDCELGSPQIPSYENRLALARLLIECLLLDDCLSLLEAMQKEDDQTVDLWYLYGWIYFIQGEQILDNGGDVGGGDEEEIKELWLESAECLEKALKIASFGQYCDQGVVEHCSQLVGEIYSRYSKQSMQDMETNGDGIEEEWQTDSEQEDGMEL